MGVTRPTKKEGVWMKVFCPESRCLMEEEIFEIPEEVRAKAEAGSEKGLWMEVFCPDEACLTDEERIDLPVKRISDPKRGGTWLSLFCPDDACAVEEPSDLA